MGSLPNQELCNPVHFPWRYSQFTLMAHWDNYLSGYQKCQNLMVAGSCGMRKLIGGSQGVCTLRWFLDSMYLTSASMFRIPKFNMHPISSAQKENILSLASNGHPTCHIASKLGIGRSTVSRVLQELLPNQQIPSAGHPSKLSPTDK